MFSMFKASFPKLVDFKLFIHVTWKDSRCSSIFVPFESNSISLKQFTFVGTY